MRKPAHPTPAPQPPELAAALGAAFIGAANLEGLIVCEPDWRVTFSNPAASVALSFEGDPVTALTLWDLQPDLVGSTAELQLRSAMAGREPVEFVAARPLNADEWIEVRALPLDGRMAFLLRDVTGRERNERYLRSTNASLRLAHKAAKAATWEWRAGRPLRWIDLAAARDLVGLPPDWNDEAVARDWRRMVRPSDLDAVSVGMASIAAKGEGRFEFRVKGGDRRERWLESSGYVAERDPSGAPRRVIGITVDVTEHKAVEATLRQEIAERERAQAHQRLLIHELNHRVKNTLATVQSIAMQSLRTVAGDDAFDLFTSRLMALGGAHDLLNQENWEGANLDEVIERMIAVHDRTDDGRFSIKGPRVRLPPNKAVAMAMALHELATNATKYGALSSAEGRVAIRWGVKRSGSELTLSWREEGGPVVLAPERRGFGSRLIERSLAAELGGTAALSFAPSGVHCELTARL
jgi:two-component sensor histidine kinase